MSEKWEMPKRFRPSKQLIDQADEQQKIWSENLNNPFAMMDSKSRERGLASIKIREYNEIGLGYLTKTQLLELAESYAEIGRFDEAAETARRADKELVAAFYLLVWGAIWREDKKWCNCGLKHRFVEKDIWSIKHNGERPLLRCNNCLTINVAELPTDIAKQRKMRQYARETSRGLTPKNSAIILERQNHTFDKLLK